MSKLPHLYKKFLGLAKEIADFDLNQELSPYRAQKELPRKFRITANDARIVMRELENEERIRFRERKIRFRC